MFTSSLYTKQPVCLQNILVSARGMVRKSLRDNNGINKLLHDIEALEYDSSLATDFQQRLLFNTLKNASENTRYYYKKADHLNFCGDVKFFLEKNFNIISKQDVIKNEKDFYSSKREPYIIGSTSGTTGTPLKIPQTLNSRKMERAFYLRQMAWAGVTPKDKRVWLRGDMVAPLEDKSKPFWRKNYPEKMLMASSYHLSFENIGYYLKEFCEYNPAFISAYPSAIIEVARYLKIKNTYYPGQLKAILTSSETLHPEDKLLIEERFQCKVFDWYGLFEKVAAIGTCEHGRYHQLTDYSYVEYSDNKDGTHEIIGTNLQNNFFPLIRYRTGDNVKISENEVCPCGRKYPVIKSIEGRVGDYLVGEDGQKVSILNHIPKGVEGLIATQFIQEQEGKVKVLTVVDEKKFNETQRKKLIHNTKKRIGNKMEVSIEVIDKIPRTKNGKQRQAICSI